MTENNGSGVNPPPQGSAEVYGAFRGSVPQLESVAEHVLENLEELELDRSEVLFGLELARMESELSAPDQVVLFVLILATMVSKQRGSVRFGLADRPTPLADRLKTYLTGLKPVMEGTDSFELPCDPSDDGAFWENLAQAIRDLFEGDTSPRIVGPGTNGTPLVREDGHLYHQRSCAQEQRLASSLSDRILTGSASRDRLRFVEDPDGLRQSLEEIMQLSLYELSPRQQYGILTAVCTQLSLVTGGPGTGKTSIVCSLVRLLVHQGIDPGRIAIAAPTGKAANRLAESLQETLDPEEHWVDRRIVDGLETASTLHRLLGYSAEWDDFYYHENRPLPHEYVIVDEASMIDLSLMDRLLSAVAQDASLCLLGDADQLPAVESGAVFRDLVPERENTDVPWRDQALDPLAEEAPDDPDPLACQAVRLHENFRVKGEGIGPVNLVKVAEAINDGGDRLRFHADPGDDDPFSVTVRSDYRNLTHEGVELLDVRGISDPSTDPKANEGPLRRWYRRWFTGELYDESGENPPVPRRTYRLDGNGSAEGTSLDELFAAYERAQLLSVTRKSSRGVRDVNGILHRYHRRHYGFYGSGTRRQFLPGEPVIMTQNDYDRGLFNGEQGLVLRVEQPSFDDPVPMAVFPGLDGYRAYHLGPLRSRLEHAFALTVHKSQGSEYGCVGVLLPDYEVPLMTRELLYTAVTRARTSAVFFGHPETLRAGARARDERNSGLVERLQDKTSLSTEAEPESE